MWSEVASSKHSEKIAIVGIGCRLPRGVESADALWQFLCGGGDAVREIPPDRWNLDAVYDPHPDAAGKSISRRAALLNDVAAFDAAFFGISPREAAVMDPQQRLLLETTWRALEDAGIPAESLAGSRTGVYVGISHSDYHGIQQFGRRQVDVHTATGGALSIAPNRISHRFDLRGPSLAIDTACSSSLVALHVACTALLSGECDTALVGGVGVILTPDVTITFSRAGMLSPDGCCKAFDARANGYVRGEGAAMVVLKTLSRALLDGDRVHGVICSTSVNQDGHTSTITVPNRDAQETMLRQACARAGVLPREIGYVEAHGTGTAVGDPIEAHAIGTVFGQDRDADDPCIIGSIKTNIGHLEPAAGVAGLIKATLCVRNGAIPPNLHFQTPNPTIDFAKLGIRVQAIHSPWPVHAGLRRAAVNSFGFGGTNACAIVEQPPYAASAPKDAVTARAWPILVPVSAATKTALPTVGAQAAEALEKDPQAANDVIGTLALRRSHFEHRTVVVAETVGEATQALRGLGDGQPPDCAIAGRRSGERRLAFVFTGQGSQWWGMGRELIQRDHVAGKIIAECDRLFWRLSGWSLREQMLQPLERSRINETAFAQPALFALQVALAARLADWGIRPQAVVGHSIGEVAAAYVAGALSLPQAVDVVYHRSRLQERSRLQGGMAALGLPAENARTYLAKFGGEIELAAINGPEMVTVAGPRQLITQFVAEVGRDREDVLCQLLRVDYAFHSSQMDPYTDELRDSLTDLRPNAPRIPMFSTVTGDAVSDLPLDAEYWCGNMRRPVLFRHAIDQAIAAEFDTFIELGPHPSLGAAVRACLANHDRSGITIGTLHRERDDIRSVASAAASLHVHGIAIDWNAIIEPGWKFIELPGYPFERKVHWAESEESRSARLNGPVHPLLGFRLGSSGHVWQGEIDAKTPRYLGDHRIERTVVFPAAGYVELMLAAAREAFGAGSYELEAVTFHEALFLGAEASAFLETSLDEPRGTVTIRSRERGSADWVMRATGRVRSWNIPELPIAPWSPKVEPPPQVGRTRFYRDLAREGHTFGPAFQGVETLWYADGCSLGKIAFPAALIDTAAYVLHPAELDCCFQVIRGLSEFGSGATLGTMAIPSRIDRVRAYRKPAVSPLFARAEGVEETSTEIVANISVFDATGRLIALLEGFRCVRVPRSDTKQQSIAAEFYREGWSALPARADVSTSHADGACVILADQGGLGESLAKWMVECGRRVALVHRTHSTTRLAEDCFETTGTLASLRRVVGMMSLPPSDVVVLWPADDNRAMRVRPVQARAGVERLLAVARAFADLPTPPRLWVVTRGGVETDSKEPASVSVLHGALTGFLRSLGNEYPELRPSLIDLDPVAPSAEDLRDEILAGGKEREVALRDGRRLGARLEAIFESALPPPRRQWNAMRATGAFRAWMDSPGLIDNVSLVAIDRPTPGPGEVVVEVRAVGLNFRDLMAVTGLLPEEAEDRPAWQHLGLECAGVVVAVGEHVDQDLVGCRVVAMTPGCLASHLVVAADAIFPIPPRLSFSAVAAIPVAFATAHYALVTLGRLKAGERILIHSAAGGVGLAAVAVAKACGAEILATAGSEDKRRYLHRLGIEHVFDSRSLDFADHVLWKTGGSGVDVVLNSLSGAFLEKSLSVLAGGGRFLEIGKRDIYANSPLGLHVLRNNGTFHAIDLARLAIEKPDLVRREVETVLQSLARGRLQPSPVTTFPVARVPDAFRHMSEGRHIGKLVVAFDGDEILVEERSHAGSPIAASATYLVTGGTGGLGLQTAQWLAEIGARELVLVGRSQRLSSTAEAVVERLRAAGVAVTVISADVGTRAGARLAVETAARSGLPLRGVVHAAGTIEDALIDKLNSAMIARVFHGKVLGAWHLHELTQKMPLDFFVMFSSIAATLGSPGQAHYAAANRALDAIAAMRRGRGLPATSIAFGPVSDQGYLTRRPDVRQYIEGVGLQPLSSADAMAGLATMLCHDQLNAGFAQIDWSRLAQAFPSVNAAPRTSGLIRPSEARQDGTDQQVRTAILSQPEGQQHGMAIGYLQRKVATVLKVEPALIERDRPLHEIGLDSLTAFELKNRIETDLGISLPVGKFLQRPTISAIAATILDNIRTDLRVEAGTESTEAVDAEMSIGQQALWFLNQFDPGNPAYALTACVSFRPHLDYDRIDEIIETTVARYPNLRVAFPSDGLGPVPTHLPAEHFRLKRHDATELTEVNFSRMLDKEANKSFELETGPLTRLHLFRRSDRDVLLLQFHHILADAASIAIVLNEVVEGYFALQAGLPLPGSTQGGSFGQFVAWQQAMISGQTGERQRSYWRKQLAGAPASLPLPTDHPRTATALGPGAATTFSVKGVMVEELKGLAQSEGTTLFSVLTAAFKILLHRYTGATDIVVGTPMSGRTRPEFERTVGYLVNALPVRTRIAPAQTFQSLLADVDASVRGALENQDCPFATIVQDLDPPREPGCFPIFQVMFGMERFDSTDPRGFAATLLNIAGPAIQYREFTVESVAVARSRAPIDLTFTIEEFNNQIFGVVDYRRDLWEAATIQQLVDDYLSILHQIVASPACKISDFALSGTVEQPIYGPEFAELPDVVASISEMAALRPEAVALADTSGDLSYAALLDRARRLASRLSECNIGRGAQVGICLPRTEELPIAILATLMTGAAYVPLDPTYPPRRLAAIIADAGPSVALTDERTRSLLPQSLPVLMVSETADVPPTGPADVRSDDLAYIIHTSGSSGRPAGVEIERGALANFLAAMRLAVPLSSDDALLAVTPYSFDISIVELLLPLTVGARVVIADEATVRDGRMLSDRLGRGDITVMQATPATWQMLIECGWSGSPCLRALCGGEALQPELARKLLTRVQALWNLYGPTETTVWSTAVQITEPAQVVPIGRPLANTTCLIVDETLTPVASGRAGELLIGGAGLARGYRNDVARTAERFVHDPADPAGRRMYFRTGDFVRLRADGTFQFLGRRDQQVKIRGFRIELGDIEAALYSHAAVREAAVLAVGDDLAERRLVAFVVVQDGAEATAEQFAAHLHDVLPPYMLPSIRVVARLPRLPNGKIARQQLAAEAATHSPAQAPAGEPASPIETQLVALLHDLLGNAEIGVDDNFFALGGTSLLGMRYVVRINSVHGLNLGAADLIRAPTVASMARLIVEKLNGNSASLTSEVRGAPMLQPGQKLWRPLSMLRAEGVFDAIDAAAIAYLPDELLHAAHRAGLDALVRRRLTDASEPHWAGVCRSRLGTIALIVIPRFGSELIADPSAAVRGCDAALKFAAHLGASTAALTGIIPAVTDFGRALAAPDSLSVTTGHATTASAVVLTAVAAAQAVGRRLGGEAVAFVGLGGIGTATLRLMLDRGLMPSRLVLCDVPAKANELERLAGEIRSAFGYNGALDVMLAAGSVPPDIYHCRVIIGATNVPGVLDVRRLAPGTIVVDDSFPPCFDPDLAIARMTTARDVLLVDGGLVSPGEPIEWATSLPENIPGHLEALLGSRVLPSATASAITGCILSALLSQRHGASASLGLVMLETCREHWDVLARLGIGAGQLRCGSWLVSAAHLAGVRRLSMAGA